MRPEYLDAIRKRYEELAVTEDGVHAEDLWPEIIKFINYGDYDGAIFGGDMMDYCSNSNIRIIKEGLDQLHIPYMYVRADHDYGVYYGGVFFTETESRALHKTIDGDEMSHKFWDMGDFIVLGIDNSTKDMPEYYYNMVADVYSRGKPVIMATHVPYESKVDDSLAQLSMQVRNQIYYWSADSEHYKPNDITQKYLNLLYSEGYGGGAGISRSSSCFMGWHDDTAAARAYFRTGIPGAYRNHTCGSKVKLSGASDRMPFLCGIRREQGVNLLCIVYNFGTRNFILLTKNAFGTCNLFGIMIL